MTLNGALAGMVSDAFPFIILEREKCFRCLSVLAATFMNPGLLSWLVLGVDSASSVFTLSCSSKILHIQRWGCFHWLQNINPRCVKRFNASFN